jgi:cardiolipin synthase
MAVLPVIGHLFFMLFGKRYKNRKSYLIYKEEESELFNDQQKSQHENLKKNQNLFSQLSKFSSHPTLQSDIKILNAGHEAFEKLFNDMEKAKKFINIHYYIIKPGQI